MDIFKHNVYRGPNIGIYASCCKEYVFFPRGFAVQKAKKIADDLGVKTVYAAVSHTRVLGIMMVANSSRVLVPATTTGTEVEHISKSTGLDVHVLESRYTALGNLVCANDRGAVVSPLVPRADAAKIGDALGVEVIQTRVGGYHQAGAMIVANSEGAVSHPETSDKEVKAIADVLKVHVELSTINTGVPFLASGLLVNDNAVIAGTRTSGPEIMMLSRAFLN